MESLLTPYSASPIPEAQSVLVLAPHPDDEVFGCGGALALHVEAGSAVHVVVATSGQEGGDAAVRREESLLAASTLGYGPPEFWDLPDRGVLYGEALVQRILQCLKSCGAQLLYAPSLWENHPDHRALALAAMEAVRRHGACALMAYEVGAPLRPNRLIAIASVIEKKRAAMACFPSQLRAQKYDRQVEALNVFRSYTLRDAGDWAEAFEYMDADALRHDLQPFLQSEYRRQLGQRLMLMPQDAGLVSVLIRSMDRPELEQALDSIAAQTWPAIEVIVVNAKGKGHRVPAEWCGRFPLRFVDSDESLSRSDAANRAMDHAQGHAMVFLDDDDYFAPDHVHRLATALADRSDAVAAITGARAVRPDGSLIYEWTGDFAAHRLMLFNQMPIMTVLFRRGPIQRRDARFDVNLDLFEDWDFWIQLSLLGAFVEVAGSSATYVMQPEQGSGVNLPEKARQALVPVRRKWQGRWPDAWLDGLRSDYEKIAPLTLQVSARSAQLQQQQAELERVSTELARVSAELHGAQQARDRAEQFNATMEHHRNLAEHHRNLAERHRQVAEQQRQIAEQQRASAEHDRHLGLEQRLTVQHERNLTAQALAQAQQALDATRQQLQAVLNSRSWLLTAPVRVAGRWLRSLRRR